MKHKPIMIELQVTHIYPKDEFDKHYFGSFTCFCNPEVEVHDDCTAVVKHKRLSELESNKSLN